MKPNLIIRASAGTGKTFSLATRFIRLMLFERVDPKTIVALTFSRAAAKEIYTKLLERLWKAAATPEGAAAERRILMHGLDAADAAAVARSGIGFTPEKFAELLRRTVDSQEVGAIATLDSFILRIVRSFPLEMGFQHAVEVLDEFGEKSATRRAGAEMLDADAGDDAARERRFASAFRTAQDGQFGRACLSAFDRVLHAWHGFLTEHPEAKGWTAESMAAALDLPPETARPSLEGLAATGNNASFFEKFRAHLAAYDGRCAIFPKNKLADMMLFFEAHPEATVWEYDTDGKRPIHKTCDCGAAGAAAVRDGIRWMVAKALRRQLEIVAAKLALCAMFEDGYDAATRRRGQLTFADFTQCQAFSETAGNPLTLENIQYRFDERFTHWALDEFQDTSKLQWKCLERLVSEAAGGEGRSVMVVGDLKQSIYGWRGGDDGPFRAIMSMGAFRGERGESLKNDVSYRYEKHTVDFINRVFGPENLAQVSTWDGACRPAVAAWLDDGCWMTHRPDVYGEGHPRAGEEKDGDYVEIVRVAKDEAADDADDTSVAHGDDDADDEGRCSAAMRILAPKICTLAADLWHRHEVPQAGSPSTDTIGILVRNNADGAYLAERLRQAADIPVVWEGVNGILDAPAVQATLQLVALAAHPEDTFAWTAVNRIFPVRRLIFPECEACADVSRLMGEMLTRLGLSRTLRTVVSRLTVREAGLSDRSVACLEALVRLAVAFEAREDGGAAIADFPDFLAASAGRETGESARVVRILTIHRSKGLTLDHVIVPILESGRMSSIFEPDRRQRLAGEGWALDRSSKELARRNPKLSAVWERLANERFMEQIRLNYVALTRARKSTYVFVVGEDHAPAVQFRDVLLAPFAGDGAQPAEGRAYGEVVFADGTPFNFGYPKSGACPAAETSEPWTHAPGKSAVRRRTPSAAGSAAAIAHTVRSMAAFFSKDFGAAVRRGTDIHAAYARIEWLDPQGGQSPSDLERQILASEFRTAFVKPSPEATVWRERAYEYFDETSQTWESGQFDRVVFTGTGADRAATIYDFKTNARRKDETPETFVRRLRALYASQMASYRNALQRLTRIPAGRIAVRLLSVATGQAV